MSGPEHVTASLRPLSRWDKGTRELTAPVGSVRIEVVAYSGDPHRREVEVQLQRRSTPSTGQVDATKPSRS